VGISDFLALLLSELYGYSMPLTTFLVKEEFLLHRPVLIFQPTVNSRASDNHSKKCQNHISQLEKMCHYKVSTYVWSVNKVMKLIQYVSVFIFKLQIEFVPFKIVPLGGYTSLKTFPLFVAVLEVANWNHF